RHEEIEFCLGPFPVLRAETVERELPDAEPATFLDGRPNAVDAAAMSLDARQTALARPAAVAVHDDGDMARQTRGVEACSGQAFECCRIVFSRRGQTGSSGIVTYLQKMVCSRSGPIDTYFCPRIASEIMPSAE